MEAYILRENVLSDNVLMLADYNEKFKGGYIAKVIENKFASAWCDREEVKQFRSVKQLKKYLQKNYTGKELEFIELTK